MPSTPRRRTTGRNPSATNAASVDREVDKEIVRLITGPNRLSSPAAYFNRRPHLFGKTGSKKRRSTENRRLYLQGLQVDQPRRFEQLLEDLNSSSESSSSSSSSSSAEEEEAAPPPKAAASPRPIAAAAPPPTKAAPPTSGTMDASKFNYRGTVYDGKFLLVVCFVVLWE